MKRILCYGDSNTWGFNPKTFDRFSADVRWTGVMAEELGPQYTIIDEGLNGRTTVWDDPFEDFRNGKSYLIPCLHSHKPLDLVIIMLGTNDLKSCFSLSAYDIAKGAGVLAQIALKSEVGYGGKPPMVLLTAPAKVGDIKESKYGMLFGFDEKSMESSSEMSSQYKRIAEELGCQYLDASQFVESSRLDAIHLDSDGHLRLGKAFAEKVGLIL